MFAEEVIDHPVTWIAAFTAFAVTIGFICQVVLQILARYQAMEATQAAHNAALKAQQAVIVVGKEAAQVRTTLNEQTIAVAGKAAEVKEALAIANAVIEDKLSNLSTITKMTHTLVNSNFGVQLKLNSTLARRLAVMTGNEADVAVAEQAERLYQEYLTKQAAVDDAKGGS